MSQSLYPPPDIPAATTIEAVIDTLGEIIEWSACTSSRLGYFAALYKRITKAVLFGIETDLFDDGPRMARLDVVFANRYFDAIRGHLHPGRFTRPTRAWHATFDAATQSEPIILQHMIAGVHAHITLDLGIAAQQLSGNLRAMHGDFNAVNDVLAAQLEGVVEDINELSPALADVYQVLMQHEIQLIGRAITAMRDEAWRFATLLAAQPAIVRPITIRIRDRQVAGQNKLICDPPGNFGLIQWAVQAVAARESRDITRNVQVLSEICDTIRMIQP